MTQASKALAAILRWGLDCRRIADARVDVLPVCLRSVLHSLLKCRSARHRPDIVPHRFCRVRLRRRQRLNTAIICGPAIGGFLVLSVWSRCGLCHLRHTFVTAAVLVSLADDTGQARKKPITMATLLLDLPIFVTVSAVRVIRSICSRNAAA